jgi:hypothetical protein
LLPILGAAALLALLLAVAFRRQGRRPVSASATPRGAVDLEASPRSPEIYSPRVAHYQPSGTIEYADAPATAVALADEEKAAPVTEEAGPAVAAEAPTMTVADLPVELGDAASASTPGPPRESGTPELDATPEAPPEGLVLGDLFGIGPPPSPDLPPMARKPGT